MITWSDWVPDAAEVQAVMDDHLSGACVLPPDERDAVSFAVEEHRRMMTMASEAPREDAMRLLLNARGVVVEQDRIIRKLQRQRDTAWWLAFLTWAVLVASLLRECGAG
jgi:hypothetical protein